MTAPSPLLIKPTRRAHATPPRPPLDVDMAHWLLEIDDEKFIHQVTSEIRRTVRRGVADALRDPRVVARWEAALREVLRRVQANLDDPDRREMPHYYEWRNATLTFRKYTLRRLDETKVLLAEMGGAQ